MQANLYWTLNYIKVLIILCKGCKESISHNWKKHVLLKFKFFVNSKRNDSLLT